MQPDTFNQIESDVVIYQSHSRRSQTNIQKTTWLHKQWKICAEFFFKSKSKYLYYLRTKKSPEITLIIIQSPIVSSFRNTAFACYFRLDLNWKMCLFSFFHVISVDFPAVLYFFSVTTGNSQFVTFSVLLCHSFKPHKFMAKDRSSFAVVYLGKRIFDGKLQWNTNTKHKTIQKNSTAIGSFVVTVLFLGDFFLRFGAEKNNKQHNKTFWNTQLTT